MLGTFCCEVVKKKQTKLQVHWLVAYTASCFNIVFCPNPSWKNQEGVRCPRTSCPPGHLVLGLDVPPHNLATEFNVEVLVDHGEMELEYDDHLYNYVAFSRYPTGSSKNQRHIIRHKCIEHFRAEDGVLCYSACRGVCERDKVSIYLMSM